MNTNGVPDYGIGLAAWPGTGFPAAIDAWSKATGFLPQTMLVYAGDFTSINTILYYLQNNNVNYWKTEPRLNGQAFTDTNGKSWPARKPVIPCIGVTNWTTSEDMTFASIVAGTNDSQIQSIAAMWFAAGFMEIEVRIGYEDQYPTTPAGVDSSSGSGGQFGGTGAIASSWQYYGFNLANWLPPYKTAWRHYAYQLYQAAAKFPGAKVVPVWGPCYINNSPISASQMDPDDNTSDGRGYLVGAMGPDEYWGNAYSDTSKMRTGYQNAPIAQMNYPTTNSPTQQAWAADEGSWFWYGDFTGGIPANAYAGPLPALPGAGNYCNGGGWGFIDSINYCKNRLNGAPVVPLMFPEHGLLNANLGSQFQQSDGLYYPPYATWLRTRVKAAQQLGIPFRSVNLWFSQSPEMLAVYGSVFPELSGGAPPPSSQSISILGVSQ